MERIISRITPAVPILPKRKRVAAYARVSSVKDAMHLSLANQVSYYSAYIQKHPEWQYAGVYADDGYTGTKDDRPEFQRLLAECYGGNIDLIITKSISRFSRNTLTTLELLRRLKEINVDVFFEKENVHSISGDGELLLTILSSFAQAESLSASENQKWRIRKNFEQGQPWSYTIYGYRNCDGRYAIVPAEAAVIRMIYDDYLSGMGKVAIMKKLNAAGVPTRFDKTWTENAIHIILQNATYTGNLLLQKTFRTDHITKKRKINEGHLPMFSVEDSHEPIIEQSVFDAVQAEIQRRAKRFGTDTSTTERNAFSGKIVCGNCGNHYRRKLNGTYAKAIWICSGFNRLGKEFCISKQIPEPILMQITAQALCIPVFDPAAFSEQIERIIVTGPNSLRYEFKDGHFTEFGWQDRSRRESWTPEMKQAAREKQQAMWEERNGNGTKGHKD